jgi:hypothetical protein
MSAVDGINTALHTRLAMTRWPHYNNINPSNNQPINQNKLEIEIYVSWSCDEAYIASVCTCLALSIFVQNLAMVKHWNSILLPTPPTHHQRDADFL